MSTRPRRLGLAAPNQPDHHRAQEHDPRVDQPEVDQAQTAILGPLEVAVVVLNANGRVMATNAAGRRLLLAGLETVLGDGRFRRLLSTLDGSDTPVEQQLAVPGSTPEQPQLQVHLRLRPLQGGAVLELTHREGNSHPIVSTPTNRPVAANRASVGPVPRGNPASASAAVQLARRIRQQSDLLAQLVDEFLAVSEPQRDPELVDGLLVPTGGVLSCRGVTLDIDAHAVTVHGKPVTLPLRQFELLKILLANAGQVVSQQQLIDLLWPRSPRDSSNGVYVHVRRLRRNLDPLCPGPSYIISVRKVGYMFASDTSSSARQAIMRHG